MTRDTRQRVASSEARTLALACLTVYVAASGSLLAAGGSATLAAAHGALALLAIWCARQETGFAGSLGDLLSLFVFPILYAEIPHLISAAGSGYHDAVIQQWDARLFGTQPSRVLAGHMPWFPLSELLHAGYLAYYPAIFVPPLLLYARRDRRGFAETVLALSVTYAICWVLFVLFPVEGPRYLWPAPPNVPDGPARRFAVSLLARGSSRGAAFPSSHMAVVVAQTVTAFRWQPRIGVGLVVVSILVGLGAVYAGFHYATDIIAGALLGLVVAGSRARSR